MCFLMHCYAFMNGLPEGGYFWQEQVAVNIEKM